MACKSVRKSFNVMVSIIFYITVLLNNCLVSLGRPYRVCLLFPLILKVHLTSIRSVEGASGSTYLKEKRRLNRKGGGLFHHYFDWLRAGKWLKAALQLVGGASVTIIYVSLFVYCGLRR